MICCSPQDVSLSVFCISVNDTPIDQNAKIVRGNHYHLLFFNSELNINTNNRINANSILANGS